MMQNRDRIEIIRQILAVINGTGNITKSKIMYKTFLSSKQFKEYLALLIEKNLLTHDPIAQKYTTTEKGIRMLQVCNQLDDMLGKKTS